MTHTFSVEAAKVFGINAAIILQHITFWVQKNAANGEHFHDGHYWTYMSYAAFAKVFPYLGMKQIRNALDKLKEAGVIITGNYSENGKTSTTWYALSDDYEFMMDDEKAENLCRNGKVKEKRAEQTVPKGQSSCAERAKNPCQKGKAYNTDILHLYSTTDSVYDDEDSYCYSQSHVRACENNKNNNIDNDTEEMTEYEYIQFSEAAEDMANEVPQEVAEKYIRLSHKYHIGRLPTQEAAGAILGVAVTNKMQLLAVDYAMSYAARNAGGSIAGYVCETLRSWARDGTTTFSAVVNAEIARKGLL